MELVWAVLIAAVGSSAVASVLRRGMVALWNRVTSSNIPLFDVLGAIAAGITFVIAWMLFMIYQTVFNPTGRDQLQNQGE